MSDATDWIATLRRASFRGVPFSFEADGIKYGKRVKVHEFPHRDRPYVEEFGEKAIDFSLTAFVASDDVLAEKSDLIAAFRQPGFGTLILPSEGAQQVIMYSCERSTRSDKLGYVAFQVSFHESGAGFGTFSADIIARIVGAVAGEALLSFAREFSSLLEIGGDASWIAKTVIGRATEWVNVFEDVRQTVTGTLDEIESVGRDITSMGRDIDRLVLGSSGDRLEFSGAVSEVLGGMRLAMDPVEAIAIMEQIADRATVTRTLPEVMSSAGVLLPTAPSLADEVQGLNAIDAVVRRVALVQMAMAAVDASFAERSQAINVRASLSDRLGIEAASAGGEVGRFLDDVRARAIATVSRRILDLKPTMFVESRTSSPSLVWAWRLYASLDRERGLIDRNAVRHPAWMPAIIEAELP